MADIDIARAVDEAGAWLDIDGVEGVAQGQENGQDCIVVGVSRTVSELRDKLPTTFHGYPVVLQDWGIISAQGSDQ